MFVYICVYIHIYIDSLPQHWFHDATRHRVSMCPSCIIVLCVYMYVCVCVYVCVYMYMCIPSHSIYSITPPGIGSACAAVVSSLYVCICMYMFVYIYVYIYVYVHSLPQHLLDNATRHRVGMCRSCVRHIRIWGFGRREYTLGLRALYMCVYVSVCIYMWDYVRQREKPRECVCVRESACGCVCWCAQQLYLPDPDLRISSMRIHPRAYDAIWVCVRVCVSVNVGVRKSGRKRECACACVREKACVCVSVGMRIGWLQVVGSLKL